MCPMTGPLRDKEASYTLWLWGGIPENYSPTQNQTGRLKRSKTKPKQTVNKSLDKSAWKS